MSEKRAMRRMQRQHGVITRRQALDAGMTSGQIRRRTLNGSWIVVARGVYRHATAEPSWHNTLLAACLSLDGLASHRSAAALHRIDGFRPIRREIVVATTRRRPRVHLAGVAVYQSSQMELAEPTTRAGVPCTGLARTVLDLAACEDRRRVDAAVDAVLRKRQLTLAELQHVVRRHARSGRSGCRQLRAVLDDRLGETAVPLSEWSRMVANLLVGAGLDRPELEHQIHTPDGRLIAQVDLAYPHQRVAIELDSVRWHLNRSSFHRDPRRRNHLTTAGWTVLTFTWHDFTRNPTGLCAIVASALTSATG